MNHWIFENTIAKWQGDSLALSWDSARPHSELRVFHPGGDTQPTCRLFGVSLDGSPSETLPPLEHVTACGATLRAAFSATERFPVDMQIAWHLLDLGSAVLALDVVVSVETRQLDVVPRVLLSTRIGDADVVLPANREKPEGRPKTYRLCRRRDAGPSYAEMIHPTDFHSFATLPDRESTGVLFRHTLFTSSLEKGVILRARLRGLLLPREDDEATADACFRRFLDTPLPLGR